MKKALVLAMEKLDRSRCKLVASVHDEYQFEADPDYAKDVGDTVVQAIIDAGTELGMRCPMDGEYKIGNSWAETH
jgi:DNA polymerase I-like protein with 3'-5' exonuclease and polymerase domains